MPDPIIVYESAVVLTGDAQQDAAAQASFEAVPGYNLLHLPATGDSAGPGLPLVDNIGTDTESINIPNTILWLEQRGIVVGQSPPAYVALDFEGKLEEWMSGDDAERVAYAQAQYIGALTGIKAYFGDGIRIACAAQPIVRNYINGDFSTSWKYATPEGKEERIAQALARYAPILACMDWCCPDMFVYCPDTATMDPAQRPYEVIAQGWSVLNGTAPGYSWQQGIPPTLDQWDEEYEVWMTYQEAHLEVVKRARVVNNLPMQPVYPLCSPDFFPFTPIFATAQSPTFVPPALFSKTLTRFRSYVDGTPSGWVFYAPTNQWNDYATRATFDPGDEPAYSLQAQSRVMVAATQFGGTVPVPDLFPEWTTPDLKLQTADSFNATNLGLIYAGVNQDYLMAYAPENAVLDSLRNAVQRVMNANGCADCVYLIDEDSPPVDTQASAVQIRVREGSQVNPLSGAGITRSQVAVALNWRCLLDRQPRADQRLSGAGQAIEVMEQIRAALNGSFLPDEAGDNLLTTPLLVEQYGSPTQRREKDGKPGWVRILDVYTYGRAFAWLGD